MSKDYYIIPIFVPHEGCPHNCIFCNQNRITGQKKTEVITGKSVYNTLDDYLKTIHRGNNEVVEVSFFGGTFTSIEEKKQRELLTVAKEYKNKGLIDKIRMSTRPDAISDYILSYLKDYEVDIIELGVQSLVDEVLVKSGRGHTKEDVIIASKLIKNYGFTLGHQIMPGLPESNFEKDLESAIESIKMKPDICRLYPSLVVRDTPMEDMYNRGEYLPYSLDDCVVICAKIYKLYKESNINVIRMGLQPTETINEGKDIVKGPFHPAFRELVEGFIMAEEVRKQLEGERIGFIYINPKDLSKLYADKKKFFKKLIEEGYSLTVLVSDKIERGNLIIESGDSNEEKIKK